MIAVAVAALLTLTALAIWAMRTIRRPIDWEGPLTAGPTLWSLQDTVNLRLATGHHPASSPAGPSPSPRALTEMDRLMMGQCTHGHGTTDRCPTCSMTLRLVAGINQMATAIFGVPNNSTRATTRALRASERDDHRREGQ